MSFFDEIYSILNDWDIKSKFAALDTVFAKFNEGVYENFSSEDEPEQLSFPSYAKICKVYKMRDFKPSSNDKTVNFLHSIAHIEYSAIDIALDACYRFRGLPKEYYFDWLEVAMDERRHFEMLNGLLIEHGSHYSKLAVHDGLFVALKNTQHSLIDRMAVLPRFMEANGLDSNMFLLQKIKNDSSKQNLITILKTIHKEEINHVKKGDKWFKFACFMQNKNHKEWINIVLSYYPNAFKTNRNIDKIARLKAGFSEDELDEIINLQRK